MGDDDYQEETRRMKEIFLSCKNLKLTCDERAELRVLLAGDMFAKLLGDALQTVEGVLCTMQNTNMEVAGAGARIARQQGIVVGIRLVVDNILRASFENETGEETDG